MPVGAAQQLSTSSPKRSGAGTPRLSRACLPRLLYAGVVRHAVRGVLVLAVLGSFSRDISIDTALILFYQLSQQDRAENEPHNRGHRRASVPNSDAPRLPLHS